MINLFVITSCVATYGELKKHMSEKEEIHKYNKNKELISNKHVL